MITIWSEDDYPAADYARGNLAPGIGGDEISCITDKSSGVVLWRRSPDGADWSAAPVEAITISDGIKAARIHSLPNGDLLLTNGTSVWRSQKYGQAGSWV